MRHMVVGICTIELYIPGNRSLKGKRRIVKSLMARIRNEFNISIAEIGGNEAWQSAILGMACVSNDAAHTHNLLSKAVEMIERDRLDVQIVDCHIETL